MKIIKSNIINSKLTDILIFYKDSITININNNIKYLIKVQDILGASNAIVYNINLFMNDTFYKDKYCLKLAPGGTINLNNNKINFINTHSNYFIKVLYFQKNIILDKPFVLFGKEWEDFDLLIMEKVDTTLEAVCDKLKHYQYINENVLECLLSKLLMLSFLMQDNNYYYLDIKPANIGIIKNGNESVFKLIDVDSLMTIHDKIIITNYTSGFITKESSSNDRLFISQIFTVFYAIFAILFNDKFNLMCDSNFLIYNKDYMLIKMFESIEQTLALKCSQYKYIILIASCILGTQYLNAKNIDITTDTYDIIINNADDFIQHLSNFLQQYFNILTTFIAKIIYSLFTLIVLTNQDKYHNNEDQQKLLYKLFNNIFNINDVINNEYYDTNTMIKINDIYRQHMNIGFIIVDSLYKYISQTCDKDCTNYIKMANIIARH